MKFDEMIDELYYSKDIHLSKKEKKILKTLAENDKINYYWLEDLVDLKPSRFNKHVEILIAYGLVDNDDEDNLSVSEAGKKFMALSKDEKKDNRKLLKFIESLNDEELENFKQSFEEITEEEPAE